MADATQQFSIPTAERSILRQFRNGCSVQVSTKMVAFLFLEHYVWVRHPPRNPRSDANPSISKTCKAQTQAAPPITTPHDRAPRTRPGKGKKRCQCTKREVSNPRLCGVHARSAENVRITLANPAWEQNFWYKEGSFPSRKGRR